MGRLCVLRPQLRRASLGGDHMAPLPKVALGTYAAVLLAGAPPLPGQVEGTLHQIEGTLYSFDLDTPPGRYSYWHLHDIGTATGIEMKAVTRELRSHEGWKPAFGVVLHGDAEGIAVRLDAPNAAPPMQLSLQRLVGGHVMENKQFARTFGIGDTLHLVISWSDSGYAVVELNGEETLRVTRASPVRTLRVTASAGDFEATRFYLVRP